MFWGCVGEGVGKRVKLQHMLVRRSLGIGRQAGFGLYGCGWDAALGRVREVGGLAGRSPLAGWQGSHCGFR